MKEGWKKGIYRDIKTLPPFVKFSFLSATYVTHQFSQIWDGGGRPMTHMGNSSISTGVLGSEYVRPC